MKYYLIAGEASGDLHASHLIAAISSRDPQADFRGIGGDLMAAQGMTLVQHYRDLAYMGVVAVVLHARTILRGMRRCREDIVSWQPDVVILVDYPGFNLKMARFVHAQALCPVYYYIAPKLWAWKEWRIKALRRDVDKVFSILPFEVSFFEGKHGLPIHYVGNPSLDEVDDYLHHRQPVHTGGSELPIIAILCGSRLQEVRNNLWRMLAAAQPYAHTHRIVIAAFNTIPRTFYDKDIAVARRRTHSDIPVEIVYDHTYDILATATAALVTSGTATLETALFRVPQIVCYFIPARRLAALLRRILIKVPYISLVNLIAGTEVVPELVCHEMTPSRCRAHLASILPGGESRETMLQGYDLMRQKLQPATSEHATRLTAPQRAAQLMLKEIQA